MNIYAVVDSVRKETTTLFSQSFPSREEMHQRQKNKEQVMISVMKIYFISIFEDVFFFIPFIYLHKMVYLSVQAVIIKSHRSVA